MTDLKSLKKILSILILLSSPLFLLLAAETITFKGGYTKAVMREGRETLMLTQGATVEVGSITFEAQNIELMGPNSRYLVGTEGVKITDNSNHIIIRSNTLSYDREAQQLLVDGWVEIQDLKNEVIASGAYLSYNREEAVMLLQISAKLLRHTESGAMICKADSIEYDRDNMKLLLVGNSTVEYKNDFYQASVTTVDLNSEEIVMEGEIKGTIHG